MIDESEQRFIKQFGRKPTANDPILFDKISQRQVDQALTEAFLETGLDPAYLYAYQKTGLLVWEGNLSLIPDKDIREWKATVREFRRMQKRKPTKRELDAEHFFACLINLTADLDRAVVFLRSIVRDHGIARNIKARRKNYAFHDFLLFCITKTLKSLSTIQLLIKEGYGEDALSLTRSIYESYLHIAYLVTHPEKINDFVAGRVSRSAGLCVRKKRPDGRWVYVDKETGAEFEDIKIADLAHGSRFKEDHDIHKILYKFLCEFAHPDFMSLISYLDGHKFDEADQLMTTQATIYAGLYACLILDIFLLFKPLKYKFRKDLDKFLSDARENFQILFAAMSAKDKWVNLLELLKARVKRSAMNN